MSVLVLEPVEKMMRKVEAIRANPLKATKIADDEFQREAPMRRSIDSPRVADALGSGRVA
ncbi:unnamed protein product [Effrenium voratum]|uniref:Uncharacterized protein n=1 Tax=Effrenium voratum TaxID=2562239 RepID=A0AA36HLE0_9DINO|nr:unnamed protein product [Effrenium voratum]